MGERYSVAQANQRRAARFLAHGEIKSAVFSFQSRRANIRRAVWKHDWMATADTAANPKYALIENVGVGVGDWRRGGRWLYRRIVESRITVLADKMRGVHIFRGKYGSLLLVTLRYPAAVSEERPIYCAIFNERRR